MNEFFVLDECVLRESKKAKLPSNFINTKTLMQDAGIEQEVGFKDKQIFEIASKYGYTIVTRDKKFALDCILNNKNVMFQGKRNTYHFIYGVKSKVFRGSLEQLSQELIDWEI